MCQNKHQSFDYFVYELLRCNVQRSHDNGISKWAENSKQIQKFQSKKLRTTGCNTFYRDTKIRIVDLIERI